jgi:protein-L-isoaspartate(D-aspartate) O-methyltransferase
LKHPAVVLVLALLALGGGFLIGRMSAALRTPARQAGVSSPGRSIGPEAVGKSAEAVEGASDSSEALSETPDSSSVPSTVSSDTRSESTSDSSENQPDHSSPLEATATTQELIPSYRLSDRTDHLPIEDSEEETYIQWMLSHTDSEESALRARWRRSRACKTLYETPDLSKPRVIEAFLRTPREIFAREANRDRAYDNAALPIGWGQTISGPHMVSRMTESIDPQPHHRVLEIGTGSGYQAAVLAQLSEFVFTIEIVRPLALQTRSIVEELYSDYPEYRNIRFKIADGYYGWEEFAPFHRIIVTAGIDHIPPALLKQLAPEGIMVIPVGPPSGQTVLKVTKHTDAEGQITLTREDVYRGTSRGNIIFVPFTDSSGEKRSSNQ